jgi:hypothetical protein
MTFWIFKVSEQRLYADIEGVRYEYDNRHSVRVRAGDAFVYLDKRGGGYRFTGAGTVSGVDERVPADEERRRGDKVRGVYAALLADLSWFEPPLDISMRSKIGRHNREAIGISDDVNAMGWSISMPSISAEQFKKIVVAGLAGGGSEAPSATGPASWATPEGLLVAPTASAPGKLGGWASPGAPHRSTDTLRVGFAAEQLVHDFLAGGELRKLGGTELRWPSRDGHLPGWDIDYKDRDGALNAVEVKGTTGIRFASIEVTGNEWQAAAKLRHRYWLYLVADCWGPQPQVERVQDPFART